MNRWFLVVLTWGFHLTPVEYANSQTTPSADLLSLAYAKFTITSDGEKIAFEKFFNCIRDGKKADYSPDLTSVSDRLEEKILTDPAYADLWKNSRVVKADWINWICTDRQASQAITSKGIEIDEAKISGRLELAWLKLDFPIRTFNCGVTDDIIMDRATIRALHLQGTNIKSLHADHLNVDRDVVLGDSFLSQGGVWFQGATIGGSLDCNGGTFLGQDGMAINLKFSRVGGTVLFGKGFRAQGEVSLQDATVAATVRCDGGLFANPKAQALSLQGARTGMVFLRNGFEADGKVWLFHTNIIGDLECVGGKFINPGAMALLIEGVEAQNVLLNSGFRAEGEVTLHNATLGGNLECDGGQFINPGGFALKADSLKAQNCLLLSGFRAEGEVTLHNATLGGNLDCDGGQFINPGGSALEAQSLKAQNCLLRSGFRAEGLVHLIDAELDGDLDCTAGQFITLDRYAFDGTNMRIKGSVILGDEFEINGGFTLNGAAIEGTLILGSYNMKWDENAFLELTTAKAKALQNPVLGWPPVNQLLLDGFTFEELDKDASLSGKIQSDWIQRQGTDTFKSQPYEQMAKVFRESGLEDDAIQVMLSKNYDRGDHLAFDSGIIHNVLWYKLIGPAIGFGYQPLKPFYWSLFFIGIGYVLFRSGYKSGLVTPTDKDAYIEGSNPKELSEFYPRFNAFVYSLEAFVPLLKLWMSDYWAPNSTRNKRLRVCNFELPIRGRGLRVYLWFHVAMGWTLTTLWLGGLTGLLKT